jgi:hypothetical protein
LEMRDIQSALDDRGTRAPSDNRLRPLRQRISLTFLQIGHSHGKYPKYGQMRCCRKPARGRRRMRGLPQSGQDIEAEREPFKKNLPGINSLSSPGSVHCWRMKAFGNDETRKDFRPVISSGDRG